MLRVINNVDEAAASLRLGPHRPVYGRIVGGGNHQVGVVQIAFLIGARQKLNITRISHQLQFRRNLWTNYLYLRTGFQKTFHFSGSYWASPNHNCLPRG